MHIGIDTPCNISRRHRAEITSHTLTDKLQQSSNSDISLGFLQLLMPIPPVVPVSTTVHDTSHQQVTLPLRHGTHSGCVIKETRIPVSRTESQHILPVACAIISLRQLPKDALSEGTLIRRTALTERRLLPLSTQPAKNLIQPRLDLHR